MLTTLTPLDPLRAWARFVVLAVLQAQGSQEPVSSVPAGPQPSDHLELTAADKPCVLSTACITSNPPRTRGTRTLKLAGFRDLLVKQVWNLNLVPFDTRV